MELQTALQKRRSVRRYIEKTVDLKDIRAMIEAAAYAPSWKNSQTARYYVAAQAESLAAVRAALPEFNQRNCANAPVLIVTTVVLNQSGYNADGTPTNELGNGWGYYDCGLHNMAMLLKAAELGLSTLIMGIRDADKIREALNIPENESIVSVISVGYSDAEPSVPNKKTVEELAVFC